MPIEVRDAESWRSVCAGCYGDDPARLMVVAIVRPEAMLPGGGRSSSGTEIALCEKCRRDLSLRLSWSLPHPCVQCGLPVEESRRCYAHPTCYACLPPPEPLPVAPKPGNLHSPEGRKP